jgi:hypothetical protein
MSYAHSTNSNIAPDETPQAIDLTTSHEMSSLAAMNFDTETDIKTLIDKSIVEEIEKKRIEGHFSYPELTFSDARLLFQIVAQVTSRDLEDRSPESYIYFHKELIPLLEAAYKNRSVSFSEVLAHREFPTSDAYSANLRDGAAHMHPVSNSNVGITSSSSHDGELDPSLESSCDPVLNHWPDCIRPSLCV